MEGICKVEQNTEILRCAQDEDNISYMSALDDLHSAAAYQSFYLLDKEDVGGYVEAFGFEDGGEFAGFFEV